MSVCSVWWLLSWFLCGSISLCVKWFVSVGLVVLICVLVSVMKLLLNNLVGVFVCMCCLNSGVFVWFV